MTRRRALSPGEWSALSPGLANALRDVGADPGLCDAVHPGARIARLWRGSTPILTRGDLIWWPGAPLDLSAPGLERAMAVLQHELQHVLDYRIGWLTAARYLTGPRHWTYHWRLDPALAWDDYGAEQRASMAEHLWLAEHGLAPPDGLPGLRRLIPWAGPGARGGPGS